jgi:hypothetical protein
MDFALLLGVFWREAARENLAPSDPKAFKAPPPEHDGRPEA